MDASGARSAGDVLRDVPGVNLLASGGRAGVTNAFIRGGDSNFTLVLLDGVALNDSTDLNGGAVNLEGLPTDFIERVEVVRGPLTSFYGPGSLSGVVQLFTRRAGPGRGRAAVGGDVGDSGFRHVFGRVSGAEGAGGYSAGAAWNQEQARVGEDTFRGLDLWATRDVALGATTALGFSGRFAAADAEDYPDGSGGPIYGNARRR